MLLDNINSPADFRHFNSENLAQLSKEVHEKIIDVVSKTGGHLGANLGVVELTIALHYVFNTPHDKLVWDVSHQTYAHKILTNRQDKMLSLRQENGISGFARREESIYDSFGAGHSSTSISAALGFEIANKLKHPDSSEKVIAIIGDGAMSAGMAYEAMNNAGFFDNRLIVILNDNKMSISPAVGAFSKYLSRIISSDSYLSLRDSIKKVISYAPGSDLFNKLFKNAEISLKSLSKCSETNLFESLGFYYIGPIDGHNIDELIKIFTNVRDDKNIHKPVLIHILTEKGRGFSKEDDLEKYHAVGKFCKETRLTKQKNDASVTYTNVFSETLVKIAQDDKNIVAITAAMESGTGLEKFKKSFPERFFDVGIAEQHAVTFAAGLACKGIKPVVAIYSTFLQRAYDQLIHDVAIQNLPVIFAIDRAGYVGADGATHAGSFDISYLLVVPNFVVMAPSSAQELQNMLYTASLYQQGPIAIRYPRGNAFGQCIQNFESIEIGKAKLITKGKDVLILSYGAILKNVLDAAAILKNHNIYPTIIDARFAKPIDKKIIKEMSTDHQYLLTIEEGSVCGFGSIINEFVLNSDIKFTKIRNIHMPDKFIEQATQEQQQKHANLDAESISKVILDLTYGHSIVSTSWVE